MKILKSKLFIIFLVIVVLLCFLAIFKDKILKFIYPRTYSEIVSVYAEKYQVDSNLIFAVIKAESNFKSEAVSNKSAIGLMQIVEDTALEVARRNNIEIDYNNVKICTVGRIGFQKNPRMFNEIAEKFPNLQFTWIGDGELRKELTSSNIKITGWKNREEVLKELNKNDIFILPSLWEGLPISLLEAMYMKKICIVSNVIGNKDVIEEGENAFISKNLDNYISIIDKVKKMENKVIKIQEKEYQDILNVYNIEEMIKKYVEEYEK